MTKRSKQPALLLLFFFLLAPGLAPDAGRAQVASQLYQVEKLAPDVYLFSAYFYSNIFVVTSEEVIATVPNNGQL